MLETFFAKLKKFAGIAQDVEVKDNNTVAQSDTIPVSQDNHTAPFKTENTIAENDAENPSELNPQAKEDKEANDIQEILKHPALKPWELADFFISANPETNTMVVSEEEKAKLDGEMSRIVSVYNKLTESENMEKSAVWLIKNDDGNFQKLLLEHGDTKQDIILDFSVTKHLTDNELAFVVGTKIVAQMYHHKEEQELFGRIVANTQVPKDYINRFYHALVREHVFEEDSISLALLDKAGIERPKSFGFLSHFNKKSPYQRDIHSAIDIFKLEPTIVERAIALEKATVKANISFDAQARKEYIESIRPVVAEQEKFYKEKRFRNGQYVGLNIDQEIWMMDTEFKIEEKILARILPSVKKHCQQIEEWYRNMCNREDVHTYLAACSTPVIPRRFKTYPFGEKALFLAEHFHKPARNELRETVNKTVAAMDGMAQQLHADILCKRYRLESYHKFEGDVMGRETDAVTPVFHKTHSLAKHHSHDLRKTGEMSCDM